jgi:hypothetical protein
MAGRQSAKRMGAARNGPLDDAGVMGNNSIMFGSWRRR